MTDTKESEEKKGEKRFKEALRRVLKTPPKPHKKKQDEKGRGGPTKSDSGISGALPRWARDCPRSKEHETTPP